MSFRATILGCGSSGGVPRLGGQWGACDPTDPRNARRRCSLLVERREGEATTRVLIDSAPDLRAQLLDAGVGILDGVVYTHAHADHTHGIDDLRMIVYNRRSRLPVWADPPTAEALMGRFGYAFFRPAGSNYPPILDLAMIEGPFTVDGPAGPVPFAPIPVQHGNIIALGFRIGGLAYVPDVSDMPDAAWPLLADLDVLVLDALRYKPHPTHAHLARSLEWIARAAPRRAILTNMHNDLDYATLAAEIPEGVIPAHDGLAFDFAP
ncbi:MBL fold metallo-hydrolase [Amaricoccus sp.]|uniref:MBL fold metallo-hydrolase n=1 Tax=Amaricoccus sp. TaxID=1872485 RepID=UPI001B3D8172|nr:MBL fold metallo-hydrolase [Amaricoccus sp.]MBP7243607.1 MBL fold metallo-hydrolase [Amaricoccus sp.]